VEREKGYTNVSMPFPEAWSGNCAPYDDIDALVDAGDGLGVNLFFRLPSDPDWSESRWNKWPQLQPAEKHGMVNGWTMHEYREMSSSSHVACRLYMKNTEAYVNEPLEKTLRFSNEDFWTLDKSWLDFDRSECFRSYADDTRFDEFSTPYRWDLSGHAMGENRTRFFDVSVRMNHKRRRIEVRRQNIPEMLSEIGGSWEISYLSGLLIAIFINQALKAASACPRDREECAEYAKRAREGFEPAKRCGQMCATGARAAAEWAKTRSPKTQKVADDATGAA